MAASAIQKKDRGSKEDQDSSKNFVELGVESDDFDSLDVNQEPQGNKWYEERLTMLAYAKGTLEFEKRTLEKRVEIQEKEIEQLKSQLRIKCITMKQNEELGHELRILRTEANVLQTQSKKQIAEKDQIIAELKQDLDKWKSEAEIRAMNLEEKQSEIGDLMDSKLKLQIEFDSLKRLQSGTTQENGAMLEEHEKLKQRMEELLTKYELNDGPNCTERKGLSEMDSPLECCSRYVRELELVLAGITKQNQGLQERGVALVELDDLRQKHQTFVDEVHRLSEELKMVKLEQKSKQLQLDQFLKKEKAWLASIVKLKQETARLSCRLREEMKEKLYLYTDLQRCKLRCESCSPQPGSAKAANESRGLNQEELVQILPLLLKCVVEVHDMLSKLAKEPELLPEQLFILDTARGILLDLKEITKDKL